MRDSISIGPVPCEEECEQLGPDYSVSMARKQCRAYVNQIRRIYGKEPEGAQLIITTNRHDFGNYLDVEVVYENNEGREYALLVEGHTPTVWDEEARKELCL